MGLLDFVRKQANQYASFQLILDAEAIELVGTSGRTSGVIAKTPRGRLEIAADLVVACDGRSSIVRDRAQLPRKDLGAPIDVLWMRLPRRPQDGDQVLATVTADNFLVMLNRGDYWQCAFLIEKGGLDELKRRGLAAFRAELRQLVPILGDRVDTLASWDDIKLLTVVVDRLERWWQRGLLCIGDAAHAMSPVGGVGINLAVQDAVAAANQLAIPLREHRVTDDDLAAVQERREPAARRIQRLQMMIHDRVLAKVLAGRGRRVLAFGRFVLRHAGVLRRGMAKTIGVGQLEHVRAPDDGVRRPKLGSSVPASTASSSNPVRSH